MPFFKKSGGASLASENSPKLSKERHDDRKSRGKGAKADSTQNSGNDKVLPSRNASNESAQNHNAARNNVPAESKANDVPSPASRQRMKKQRSAPKPTAVPPPDPGVAPQTPPRFVFYCQLAHGSATAKVEGFTNVKQLYEKIATAFHIKDDEILFCTLNTYRVDMDRLLGGQIGLDDFIFAHIKGQGKKVEVIKDQPSLGLTITDNGAGCAFIKRIKEGSIADKEPQICVGDHVESINNVAVVGKRHFDVAQGIGPRTSTRGQAGAAEDAKTEKAVGSGKATLRLKAKGPPVVENIVDTAWEQVATKKVDDLLESFLGIRDEELANNLVALSKNKENPSDFAICLDEEYADFQFPDDFIFDLWGVIGDAKKGRI
ncbi:hypothetical protein QZH41_011031 [Actinostola sp. cb2023]|nr:hypothetical protein QZH41_011031 [Actinostola sp. cb2023]